MTSCSSASITTLLADPNAVSFASMVVSAEMRQFTSGIVVWLIPRLRSVTLTVMVVPLL